MNSLLAKSLRVVNNSMNRVLIPTLRSPAGRLLGRRLAVVSYTGRRTGRTYDLVTLYARVDDTVVIAVGAARHKTWWRQFREPDRVELWLNGRRAIGTATTIDGARVPGEVLEIVAVVAEHAPILRRLVRLPASVPADDPTLLDRARRTVLVRVEVQP